MKRKLLAILATLALALGLSGAAVLQASPASASGPGFCYAYGPGLDYYGYGIAAHTLCAPSAAWGYPQVHVIATCLERLDYTYGWVNDDGPGWCNSGGAFFDTAPLNCVQGSSTVFRGTTIADTDGPWYFAATNYFYPCH